MEIVIASSLGVFVTVFAVSAIAVFFACRQKYCRKPDFISQELAIYNDERILFPGDSLYDGGELDLTLDDIARNEAWVKDATGLTPHCLSVLRLCHSLSDRLLAAAVADAPRHQDSDCIASVARQLSQHVEDVASAMYPPLDPRLVEARCTALKLCMTNLVLLVKRACHLPSSTADLVTCELRALETHLAMLREESKLQEATFHTSPLLLSLARQPTNVTGSLAPLRPHGAQQLTVNVAACQALWTTANDVSTA